ncbi:MAG: FAD-binding oxidoreductase, partial [Candidatus Eremiobacteraeota bacterium]|nr:FAD-binding oxidoreductase [Candidatus Eremiobacteraeota bacterium]
MRRSPARPRVKAAQAETFAADARVAGSVATPLDELEAARVLREAGARGDAVVAFGGGTLQGIGNPPRTLELALSTRRLDAIFAYDYRDLTIGAGAGLTLARLNSALAQHKQFIPLDAPHPSRATLGGTLAAGWLGPRRARYGRPRDLLIGTTAALADGTLAHSGGMVVKNVTGYDLSKLYVGSLGTLGVLTRTNFKTLPIPQGFRLAVAPLPEGTRERAAQHVRGLALEPTAALLFSGFRDVLPSPLAEGADGTLLLLFEGSAAAIERATRDLRSALGAAGVPQTRIFDADAGAHQTFQRAIDAYVASIPGRSVTLRALGLPEGAMTRERAAREALEPAAAFLDTIVDLQSGDLIARIFVDGKLDPLAVRGTLSDAVASLRERLPDAIVLARGLPFDGEIDAWGAPPA